MKIIYNSKLKNYAKELRKNMTFAEKATWRMIKNKQLHGYDFHRQKPIGEYIADFFCFELKLVIEIDGITHQDNEVKLKDEKKSEYFTSIGLDVIRFTDEEVLGNWEKFEKTLVEFIGKRRHTPSPSF